MRYFDVDHYGVGFETMQKAADYAAVSLRLNAARGHVQISDSLPGVAYPYHVFERSENPAFACVGTGYKTRQKFKPYDFSK